MNLVSIKCNGFNIASSKKVVIDLLTFITFSPLNTNLSSKFLTYNLKDSPAYFICIFKFINWPIFLLSSSTSLLKSQYFKIQLFTGGTIFSEPDRIYANVYLTYPRNTKKLLTSLYVSIGKGFLEQEIAISILPLLLN